MKWISPILLSLLFCVSCLPAEVAPGGVTPSPVPTLSATPAEPADTATITPTGTRTPTETLQQTAHCPPEPTREPSSNPTSGPGGSWYGTMLLNNDGGGSRYVILQISLGSGGTFFGSLTFEDPYGGATTTLTGSMEGDQFRFLEGDGRHFWGTISGDSLTGQVAWDCFECSGYAQVSLQRGTPIPKGYVCILNQEEGSSVKLVDGPLGPEARLWVRSTRTNPNGRVFLQVDGLNMAASRNLEWAEPFETVLTWWPWHGNGEYTLEVSSWDWNACCRQAIQTVRVQVDGFPEGEETIQERFIRFYRDKFGLVLSAPVFFRYLMPFPDAVDKTRWISAAYIEDTMYEINLFDNGSTTSYTRPIGHESPGETPLCRPAGRYRMLVAFVDYGNTGISRSEALQALADSVATINQFFLERSQEVGESSAILQVQASGVILDGPTVVGQVESVESLASRTALDLGLYDLLVEVDLDRDRNAAAHMVGLGFGGPGCYGTASPSIDIFMTLDGREAIQAGLTGSVFDHELSHSLGWMHWWPNGDGSTGSLASTDMFHNAWFPSSLFGWIDSDGDGALEILDATPYGLAP